MKIRNFFGFVLCVAGILPTLIGGGCTILIIIGSISTASTSNLDMIIPLLITCSIGLFLVFAGIRLISDDDEDSPQELITTRKDIHEVDITFENEEDWK